MPVPQDTARHEHMKPQAVATNEGSATHEGNVSLADMPNDRAIATDVDRATHQDTLTFCGP